MNIIRSLWHFKQLKRSIEFKKAEWIISKISCGIAVEADHVRLHSQRKEREDRTGRYHESQFSVDSLEGSRPENVRPLDVSCVYSWVDPRNGERKWLAEHLLDLVNIYLEKCYPRGLSWLVEVVHVSRTWRRCLIHPNFPHHLPPTQQWLSGVCYSCWSISWQYLPTEKCIFICHSWIFFEIQ